MAQFSKIRERLGNRLAFNCFVTGPFVVFISVFTVSILTGVLLFIALPGERWMLFMMVLGLWVRCVAVATGLFGFLFLLAETFPVGRQRRPRRLISPVGTDSSDRVDLWFIDETEAG
jgi:hypothetical protein